DAVERLGHGPDLVQLDQDRVRDALLDALLQARGARDEQVVADELQLLAELLREELPAGVVVLVAAVLDRHEREGARELLVDADDLLAGALRLVEGVLLVRVAPELRQGAVEGEADLL